MNQPIDRAVAPPARPVWIIVFVSDRVFHQVEVKVPLPVLRYYNVVVDSRSQTSDARRQFDADALKVECAWRTFRSLSRTVADDSGMDSILSGFIEVEPMLHEQSDSVETDMTSLSAM